MRRVLRHSGSLSKGTLESCVYVDGVNNGASDGERQERHSPSPFLFPPAAPSIFVRKGEQ